MHALYFNRKGFNLIELLIVIAIILILIAIALPHFLAARIRANLVRANSELKNISICLNRYYTDFGFYPLRTTTSHGTPGGLDNLTTPIPYMKPAHLPDPFPQPPYYTHYRYWPIRPSGYVQDIGDRANNKDSNWFLLSSNGPDCDFDPFAEALRGTRGQQFRNVIYSPTNGLCSYGNVWRIGGSPDGLGRVQIVLCMDAIPQ